MWQWPVLWLALIFGPFLVDGHGKNGRVTKQPESSGPVCCSNPPLRCATGATCTHDHQCQCPREGNGTFVCYNTGVKKLEVKRQDLRTWAGQDVPLSWPCQTCLTAFQTEGSGPAKKCKLQVFGLFDVNDGHHVLLGVQVFIVVILKSGDVRQIAFQNTGYYSNGIYTFLESSKESTDGTLPGLASAFNYMTDDDDDDDDDDGSGSGDGESIISDDEDDEADGRSVWGDIFSLDLPGGHSVSSQVDADNFVVIKASPCGVNIKFRPPGVGGSVSRDVPGLSVAVDAQRASSSIIFEESKRCLAEGLKYHNAGDPSLKEAFFHLVLKYPAAQDGPSADKCDTASQVYDSCPNTHKDKAVKTCSEILTSQDLADCLRNEIEHPTQSDGKVPCTVELFNLCLKHLCHPNKSSCQSLKNSLGSVPQCAKKFVLKISHCV